MSDDKSPNNQPRPIIARKRQDILRLHAPEKRLNDACFDWLERPPFRAHWQEPEPDEKYLAKILALLRKMVILSVPLQAVLLPVKSLLSFLPEIYPV
jgi:hypothetical protein